MPWSLPDQFRAFLSYSHADARWASWLLRRLETYLVGAKAKSGPVWARSSAIATSCPLGHHHPPALDSRAIGPPDPESVGPAAHAPARAAIPPKRSHDHAQHPEHQSRRPASTASSDPGWHNVAASNGQTYGYCYTGGDDGAGGLDQTVGQGRDTAPLQLVADQRYQIN